MFFLGDGMWWFKKQMAKRWLKELHENIKGMRRMAAAYEAQGGFKEIAETLETIGVTLEGLTSEFLQRGREAELEFAKACRKLADHYEKIYEVIKRNLEDF